MSPRLFGLRILISRLNEPGRVCSHLKYLKHCKDISCFIFNIIIILFVWVWIFSTSVSKSNIINYLLSFTRNQPTNDIFYITLAIILNHRRYYNLPPVSLLHLRRICSDEESFKLHAQGAWDTFQERNYLEHFIKDAFNTASNSRRDDSLVKAKRRDITSAPRDYLPHK